ncbi:hypothetical protein C8R47DRAFT_1152953 [Mycena vitilis]|nr:hypothetical protein C8R47DRAFT_1152953 [Mycena vitilis]
MELPFFVLDEVLESPGTTTETVREIMLEIERVTARIDEGVRWQRRLGDGLARISPALSRKLLRIPKYDYSSRKNLDRILARERSRIHERSRAYNTVSRLRGDQTPSRVEILADEDPASSMEGEDSASSIGTVEGEDPASSISTLEDEDSANKPIGTVVDENLASSMVGNPLDEDGQTSFMVSTLVDELQERVESGNEESDVLNLAYLKWFLGKLGDAGHWDVKLVAQWLCKMNKSTQVSEFSDNPPDNADRNAIDIDPTEFEDSVESEESGLPFIVYASQSLKDSQYLRTEELRVLADQVADDKFPFLAHSPDLATAWVEAHYNHPQIVEMRSECIGGPMAAMLSPYEEGLVIFAPRADSVLAMASSLSELSHFPVMVQDHMHNPVLQWDQKAQEGAEVTPGTDEPNNGHGHPPMRNVQQGRVSRLRGGAGSEDSDPDYDSEKSETHSITEILRIPRPKGLQDLEVQIRSFSQFTVQKEYQDKNKNGYRPHVISSTQVQVSTVNIITPIRSYSSVGFLVPERPENQITHVHWIDCGHDMPLPTFKRTNLTGKERAAELGYKTAKLTAKWNASDALERTNDRVTPNWIVSKELGRPEVSTQHCVSYDITYDPTWITREMSELETIPGSKIVNHLDVTFSVGVNLLGKNIDERNPLPAKPVTFVVEHQTMVWTQLEDLQTKGICIAVVSSYKIPDIQEKVRHVHQATHVLDLNDLSRSRTTTVPQFGPETSVSLSVGTMSLGDPTRDRSIFDRIKAALKRQDGKRDPLVFPLYPLVARDWDASHGRWRSPVYPTLDRYFRPATTSRDVIWNMTIAEDKTEPLNIGRQESQSSGGSNSQTTHSGRPPSVSTPATSVASVGGPSNVLAAVGTTLGDAHVNATKVPGLIGKGKGRAIDVPVPDTV